MFTQRAFSALAGVAALGFFAAAQPAVASDTSDTVSVTVGYGDLNLDTSAGAKVMLRRIHNAAKDICGPEPQGLDQLDGAVDYARCVQPIVDRAVAKLDSPLVTARNGRSRDSNVTMVASARR